MDVGDAFCRAELLCLRNRCFRPALEPAVKVVSRFRPAFLVVSFGADTHEADPIGGFRLSADYFTRMARTIGQLDLPAVLVQEGGYGLADLGTCAAAFVRGWLE